MLRPPQKAVSSITKPRDRFVCLVWQFGETRLMSLPELQLKRGELKGLSDQRRTNKKTSSGEVFYRQYQRH